MSCEICHREVPIENKDTGMCATCNRDERNNTALYPMARQMFLTKMIELEVCCPVWGSPITMESDIHHKRGRVGYASEAKRQQGISLLIDVDFFLACSRLGHIHIENNYANAIASGWSESRQTIQDDDSELIPS
ncbi:MAG: hypothetical protein WKF87_06690 [Chryseolinea sp.]